MGARVYIGHKHLPSTWHPPFFNLTLSFFPLQLLPFSSPILFIGNAAEPSGPPALRASELWLRTKREEPLFFVLPSGRCLPRGGETWWSRYERHSGQWQNAAFVSGHTRSLYLCLYKQVLPSVVTKVTNTSFSVTQRRNKTWSWMFSCVQMWRSRNTRLKSTNSQWSIRINQTSWTTDQMKPHWNQLQHQNYRESSQQHFYYDLKKQASRSCDPLSV